MRLSQTTRIIKHPCGQHCGPNPAFSQPSFTSFCFIHPCSCRVLLAIHSFLCSGSFQKAELSLFCSLLYSFCSKHLSSLRCRGEWLPNGMSTWPLISGLTHLRICEVRNRLSLVGWNSSLCIPGWGCLCLWLLNQSLSVFFLVFLRSPSYLCHPASSAVSCDVLAQPHRALWSHHNARL